MSENIDPNEVASILSRIDVDDMHRLLYDYGMATPASRKWTDVGERGHNDISALLNENGWTVAGYVLACKSISDNDIDFFWVPWVIKGMLTRIEGPK